MTQIKVNVMRNQDGDEYEMIYNQVARDVWEWDGAEPTGFDVDTNNDELVKTYVREEESA